MMLFNGLWVVVWGPRVVPSVTCGTIQALRVPFNGLWVVVWGPRVVSSAT